MKNVPHETRDKENGARRVGLQREKRSLVDLLCVKLAASVRSNLEEAAVAHRLNRGLVVRLATQDHLLVDVSVVHETASLLGPDRILQILLLAHRLNNHWHVERDIREIHRLHVRGELGNGVALELCTSDNSINPSINQN